MSTYRSSAVAIGVLFLIALIFNLIATEILDPVLKGPDYLAKAYPQSGSVVAGNLLNLICAVAMIFIPIVLLPIAKRNNPGLAAGYLVFRALEGILFIYIAIKTLSFIGLSQAFLSGDQSEAALSAVGSAVHAEIRYATVVYIVIFALGAVAFYALLFRSRLVPRLFSVWGLLAVPPLVAGAVLGLFEVGLFSRMPFMDGMAYFAPPIALNELVLAIWLIAKGFAAPTPSPAAAA